MPRGEKKSQKGSECTLTEPKEIDKQLAEGEKSSWRDQPKNDESSNSTDEKGEGSDEQEPHKGTAHLMDMQNPNQAKTKPKKISDLGTNGPSAQLSKREKEALDEAARREKFTDATQADLARLALIRIEREEAAKKRGDEKAAKEADRQARQAEATKKLVKPKGKAAKGKGQKNGKPNTKGDADLGKNSQDQTV